MRKSERKRQSREKQQLRETTQRSPEPEITEIQPDIHQNSHSYENAHPHDRSERKRIVEAVQSPPTPPQSEVRPEEAQSNTPVIASSKAEALAYPVSASTPVPRTNAVNGLTGPAGTGSLAEEKMKEYLVGEGIKRAHLKALYQKPTKEAKKTLFKRIFKAKGKDGGQSQAQSSQKS